MEKTLRRHSKWAKISGKRGAWSVAKGWAGDVKAARVLIYPTKGGALVAARYWIND